MGRGGTGGDLQIATQLSQSKRTDKLIDNTNSLKVIYLSGEIILEAIY